MLDQTMDVKQTWTLADQLEELRGKYHLKNKDCGAYRESSQDEIREKDRIIADLRQQNWNKRIILAQHENGDQQVVKSVFSEDQDRLLRLSLQRCTATQAICEMDQNVCEGAKVLNMTRYGREMREKKLNELQQELKRMKFLHKNSPEQNEGESKVTELENSLDKALIKYDTATSISRRYQDILEKLKEESLTLPAKLDAMEQALIAKRAELQELQVLARDAQQARDQTKRHLSKVEQDSYESRKCREAELSTTRKEVDRRKAEAEKVERRHARATLLVDNQDQKAQLELQAKQEKQEKILTYDMAFRLIRDATHVTSMDEVVARVLCQQDKQAMLKSQVSELESQRQRMRTDMHHLNQQFHDMKYSGEKEISRGEAMVESMQNNLDKEQEAVSKIDEKLLRSGNTLVNVKAGVNSLLNKLMDLTASSHVDHQHELKGSVEEQIPICRRKLDTLLRKISSHAPDIEAKLGCNEFQEFLEDKMPIDNIRVKLDKADSRLSTLSEFDFETQDTEQALGRLDIKKMGQKMIDGKVKPKRGKKTKKK